MLFSFSIFSSLEVLLLVVPALLGVAYVTVAERKTMASMQRRVGPNKVGYLGLLQAFADALKLILKEYVSPTQANLILFFLGPIITLVFSLLGYAVIPYGPGLAISDYHLGILYMLAVSSLSTYGILLAGWSANSKYAFLGSLRSTAQLISYELILSTAILFIILFTGSLNLTDIVESQKSVWFILPLLPIFIIFFIGALAETNRAPMDLAEADPSRFMNSLLILKLFLLGRLHVFVTRIGLSGYFYSTSSKNSNNIKSSLPLDPNWVTGFTDAEGYFTVKTFKSKAHSFGWRTQPQFGIALHKRDEALLQRIKEYFGVGTIYTDRDYVVYAVRSLKELTEIPHFEKHPLLTQKRSDFELFKQIVLIKANNRKLSQEQFEKILAYRANLNTGSSEELKNAFPNVCPVPRPFFALQEIPSPQWLIGFIDGEGCFIINTQQSISTSGKTLNKTWLSFYITQHTRDSQLMESIVKYLDCGKVFKRSSQAAVDFKVTKFDEVIGKIIPFLQKYPLQSVKHVNFLDWVEASNLIENKEHLTAKGLEKINIIKDGMNKKREDIHWGQ